MNTRATATVLAAALTLLGSGTATASPGPHGDLLAASPARASLPGGARAVAWRLSYSTTSATGVPTTATGALLAPASAPRRRHGLIAVGVGSQGLADACAPSRNLRSGALLEAPLIAALVGRGWSVVVPDGQGLGSAGPPTYGAARADGQAMLDAVSAARRVEAAGSAPTDPVGLLGYSTGGGTVAAAAELQPTYAPELRLAGAAAGGAVVDVPAYVRTGLRSGATVAALSALLGFTAAYPDLRLAPFLTARGRVATQIAAAQCIYPAIALAAAVGGRGPRAFLRRDPFDDPAWAARATQAQLGRAAPSAPVLLFHGLHDQAVPVDAVRDLRDRWRAEGTDVSWLGLSAEHVGAMVAGQAAAVAWIERRFTSLP